MDVRLHTHVGVLLLQMERRMRQKRRRRRSPLKPSIGSCPEILVIYVLGVYLQKMKEDEGDGWIPPLSVAAMVSNSRIGNFYTYRVSQNIVTTYVFPLFTTLNEIYE